MENKKKYVLDKMVIYGAYGNRSGDQIKKIQVHLQDLLKLATPENKKVPTVLITKCKKPNAIFKIKKGGLMGLKVTLRKELAHNLIQVLSKVYSDLVKRLTYNNNTLFVGLNDHKRLKLEKYKYNVPEYGLNFAITFMLAQRKSLLKQKIYKNVPHEECKTIIQEIIKQKQ